MIDPFDFAVSAALAALVAGRAPSVAEMDPRGDMDTCLLVLAASRARDELAAPSSGTPTPPR
jgi:hypothetical protein